MRTSIDLSDELFRRAKMAAASRGLKFKELVEEGLLRVLESPDTSYGKKRTKKTLFELMEEARREVTKGSGVNDLATNPKHMKGFGRD